MISTYPAGDDGSSGRKRNSEAIDGNDEVDGAGEDLATKKQRLDIQEAPTGNCFASTYLSDS
jgi:hypothetical protein